MCTQLARRRRGNLVSRSIIDGRDGDNSIRQTDHVDSGVRVARCFPGGQKRKQLTGEKLGGRLQTDRPSDSDTLPTYRLSLCPFLCVLLVLCSLEVVFVVVVT